MGSFILSALVISWHLSFVRSSFNSKKYLILNQNLKKLNLFWSNTESNFVELHENSLAEDRKKALRTVALIGILAFASLPGFLLVLASVLSIRYLARPRKERFVFQSDLSDKDLEIAQIKDLVGQAKERI